MARIATDKPGEHKAARAIQKRVRLRKIPRQFEDWKIVEQNLGPHIHELIVTNFTAIFGKEFLDWESLNQKQQLKVAPRESRKKTGQNH